MDGEFMRTVKRQMPNAHGMIVDVKSAMKPLYKILTPALHFLFSGKYCGR